MEKKFFLIVVFVFVLMNSIFSQQKIGKYLVQFKDKIGSTYSITKPEEFLSKRSIDRRAKQGIKLTTHDLPPNKNYVEALIQEGAKVWYKSRWYNGALILADSATVLKIKALPFVKGFENNGPMDLNGSGNLRKQSKFDIQLDSVNHGNGSVQARMLGTHHLHYNGFKGKGMMIAVLDDGFNRVDKDIYMKHLFDEKRVVTTYDFVRNTPSVYDIGGHGNLVLSTMAANVNGKFVGTSPEASYVLLRSEDAPTERIIEEANWLFAAEYADSVGVDVINSSLGYVDFDYAPYTHVKADFDGDKALSTKAGDWAAAAGILVCASAGNSGVGGIGAPADGDSVMAIGSVNANLIKSGFSSVGPSVDGRIKPDVSAMGTSSTVSAVNAGSGETQLFVANGTSFSGPIFAGFATCFWQANPTLKVMEVQSSIKKLGNQADKPDNLLGYGVPQFGKIVILSIEKEINSVLKIYPNPVKNILKIELPDNFKNKVYDLSISDILGRQILNEKTLFGQYELDATYYYSGVYFGRIIVNDQIINFKFLKQ